MLKDAIRNKDLIVLKIPNNMTTAIIKQKLEDMQREYTFNLTKIKWTKNQDVEDLNNIISELDLLDLQ